MTTSGAGGLELLGFPPELADRAWTGPDRELQVRAYSNARALPLRRGGPGAHQMLGCIYDNAGAVVVDSERAKVNRAWSTNPPELPPELAGPADRLPGRTLFAGHRRPVFGHFLLEMMPRFWPDLDYTEFDHVLVQTTRVGERLRGPVIGYEADLLTAVGLDPSQLVLVDRPFVVEDLTVTTPALVLKRGVDLRFVDPFDRAVAHLLDAAGEGGSGRRIYLSRTRLAPLRRQARNEPAIESLLQPLGFKVLHPQEMSIAAQVAAVRAAEVIAGCDGSALHLGAFARPGTVIFAIDSRLVENQLMIDIVRGLNAFHVLAPVGGAVRRDEFWDADLELVRKGLSLAGLAG